MKVHSKNLNQLVENAVGDNSAKLIIHPNIQKYYLKYVEINNIILFYSL